MKTGLHQMIFRLNESGLIAEYKRDETDLGEDVHIQIASFYPAYLKRSYIIRTDGGMRGKNPDRDEGSKGWKLSNHLNTAGCARESSSRPYGGSGKKRP